MEFKIEPITNTIKTENRVSRNIMTKFEYAGIISVRRKQLESGDLPKIDPPIGMTDAKKIAEYELRNKKTPLRVLRIFTTGVIEMWDISELIQIRY